MRDDALDVTAGEECPIRIRQYDHPDVLLAQAVQDQGFPNWYGARIPVASNWNLTLLDILLTDYQGRDIVQWLQFGWLVGRPPSIRDQTPANKNHKGAVDFPDHVNRYIQKELDLGGISGPFREIPLKYRIRVNPLSSQPKKDSESRRFIMDMSFPKNESVNDGIPKDTYMGLNITLKYPTVDVVARKIFSISINCKAYKKDLDRAFRQMPVDPGDYSLLCFQWQGKFYFDKVLTMGQCSAPYICQRVNSAFPYVMRKRGYFLVVYIDDFFGAEYGERALQAYNTLGTLFKDLGVEVSVKKNVPPTAVNRIPGHASRCHTEYHVSDTRKNGRTDPRAGRLAFQDHHEKTGLGCHNTKASIHL